MSRVTLTDVTKIYGDDVIGAEDISFRIQDGEFLILVGPSGCGKSTTLRMLAGLEQITDGELRLDDIRTHSWATPTNFRGDSDWRFCRQ